VSGPRPIGQVVQASIAKIQAEIDRLAPEAIREATKLALANGWDGHVIGSPMPAGDKLYALARAFARPVARGYLTAGEALAWLMHDTLKAARAGQLGTYRASDVYGGLRHILGMWLKIEDDRRAIATQHVKAKLRPLIALHKKSNVLLAEAHGINGQEGFPLTQPEVTDIAAMEIWFSLPTTPGRHRNGS
jgi:hypothetical protein